ncbi:DUF2069 domain-containing protein [Endozoicomonas sp. 8E]|uniref:DUF2069 domain-containing protein n=1 Tax=Endozoicomonas sp. 8E TaxID=3035692 RepID=UPI002939485B|nr:DUF2069 domain-containing protein [Endozoicomonas sp. 8E]WOG26135.1 DUF2069 domain-containing protein [Endozoicomonas sp. 8E]
MDLNQKARLSYRLSLLLYFCLLASQIAKVLWLHPPQNSAWMIASFTIVPLLLPLYGLIRRQPRASAWLCFILCFYFISGVLDAWFIRDSIHGWLITAFSSALFVSAMMFTRWQGQLNNLPR